MTRPATGPISPSGLEGRGRECLQAGARKVKRQGRLCLGAPGAAGMGSEGRKRTCSDFFMKRHPGGNTLPEIGFPMADRDFT